MSNVHLQIGGRNFSVASADGEEPHIEMLGRMIDERLQRMGAASGQSETRMLLFAALVLADELHDAHNKASGGAAPVPEQASVSPEVLARMEALADRVEKLAADLEQDAITA